MDTWKFFAVTRREHTLDNPTSSEKLDQLIALLRPDGGARVLDIACGKAELICRLAERHGASCIGVDVSPFMVEEARSRIRRRNLSGLVTVEHADGATYPAEGESFDIAMCVGASWVWKGYRGTLDALSSRLKPEGMMVLGEPYWRRPPDPAYLAASGMTAAAFGTHHENVIGGEDAGLRFLYAIVSSEDDWDRYEGLSYYAAEQYAAGHREDPDSPAIVERMRKARDLYLRWGRDTLGWALYLFRKP